MKLYVTLPNLHHHLNHRITLVTILMTNPMSLVCVLAVSRGLTTNNFTCMVASLEQEEQELEEREGDAVEKAGVRQNHSSHFFQINYIYAVRMTGCYY